MWKGIPPLLAALLLLAPAAEASSRSGVRVQECRAGTPSDSGLVRFRATMRAVQRSEHMALRFVVQERYGDDHFRTVPAPGLGVWRRARRGVSRFSYTQTVKGLRAGGDYRAVVYFRWRDENGRDLRGERRTSAICRQPGGLPNLRLSEIEARETDSGAYVYFVKVANLGGSAATDFDLRIAMGPSLDVPVWQDTRRIDRLRARSSRVFSFTGAPPCAGAVEAVVDPGDDVAETSEADNARREACPAR